MQYTILKSGIEFAKVNADNPIEAKKNAELAIRAAFSNAERIPSEESLLYTGWFDREQGVKFTLLVHNS